MQWQDDVPIYKQLRDYVVGLILNGELAEGAALPSVRQVAQDFRLNPLTVSKAWQCLAEEDLLDKRRGVGQYIKPGAREQLIQAERARFLREEWPRIAARIQQLGLTIEELSIHSADDQKYRRRVGS
jgi:GntR family transcriptional regulator